MNQLEVLLDNNINNKREQHPFQNGYNTIDYTVASLHLHHTWTSSNLTR